MSAALHILQSEDHVAAFDLQPGSHLLGIGEDADLVLSDAHAKNDLCDVEVTPEPQVTLRALPNIPLRSPHREASAEMIVAEGRFVEVSDPTITLLRTSDLGDVQVDPPRSVPVTAKSPHVHAPAAENLALLVTTTHNAKVVEIDRPRITIGREMGNTVRIAHEHVSAWHAEVVQKADGLWLNVSPRRAPAKRGPGEDLRSRHATSADPQLRSPPGGKRLLSLRVPPSQVPSATSEASAAAAQAPGSQSATSRLPLPAPGDTPPLAPAALRYSAAGLPQPAPARLLLVAPSSPSRSSLLLRDSVSTTAAYVTTGAGEVLRSSSGAAWLRAMPCGSEQATPRQCAMALL